MNGPKTVTAGPRLAFAIFFMGALIAMIWPVYPYFSRIEPMVLGLPFALFYLILILILCFLVLLALYLWEEHRGDLK